ncbi:MAG: hypothetical protein ACLST8_07625 [Agathobaculum sp.]
MAEYIDRGTAIAKLTDLDIIEPNATMTGVKRLLADIPGAKVVSLHDIYRVIAGHSYYHGDHILAALSCIAEGKEVNPARPTDVVPVVRCKDCKWFVDNNGGEWYGCKMFQVVRITPEDAPKPDDFCSYGERIDGGADNG